jgi:hypothetical protein
MTLQRIALGIVATVAWLSLTPALQADPHVTVSGFGVSIGTPEAGIGFWIGGRAPERHVYHPPVYRHHPYYGHPWRHGYVRVGPPVAIVRPPVVVQQAPPVVIQSAPPVIPSNTVTVWITNSNGSQTSVQLTRYGRWYIGPRGEYYVQMPTNEQLRVAYGF